MGFSEDTQWKVLGEMHVSLIIYRGTSEINRMLSVGMLIKMKGHVDLLGPILKLVRIDGNTFI
jgi:hypothetical protein